MRLRISALAPAIGLFAVGCAAEVGEAPTGPEAPIMDRVAPPLDVPFDLSDAIRRARLAFIDVDGRLVGGSPTLETQVTEKGALAVRPVDWRSDLNDEPLRGEVARFETHSVARSASGVLELAPARTELGVLGEARVDRGILVETFTNDHEGTEQAWHFASEPEGSGDLVVSVAVTGFEHVASDRDGHHFQDPGTELLVRYGRAFWVDATERRTEVAVEVEGSELVLRVPESLVVDSQYPAILDPTVSPERVVGSPVTGPNPQDEADVDVAFAGSSYFAVWADVRSGVSYDVYGARIAATGAVTDTRGVQLTGASGDQRAPAVSWNGAEFLVTWQDTRGADTDIYGQRVSSTATLVGGELSISSATGNQTTPEVAAAGATWVVAWTDARSGTADVFAARVNGSTVSSSFGLGDSATRRQNPAVACSGSACLVAWEEGAGGTEDVRAAIVPAAGAAGAAFTVSAASLGQRNAAAAFDGTNFLVVWQDQRINSSNFEIYAAGVTLDGNVLDVEGVRLTNQLQSQVSPSVAFAGGSFLVVWQDVRNGSTNRDIYGQRVDSSRALLGGEIAISTAPGNQELPSVTAGGSGFVVAWADGRNLQLSQQKEIYFARVGGDGSVQDGSGRVLTLTGNRQTLSNVATDGSQFLVVWSDSRGSNGSYDLWGALFNGAGTLLRLRTVSSDAGDQLAPSIAHTAGTYMVSWHDNRAGNYDVYAASITPSGNDFSVGAQLTVSAAANDQRRSAIAGNGSSFLVVWEDRRNGSNADIYGQRLTTSALLGGELAIRTGSADENRPAVASDGVDWFVVWSDARGGTNEYDIYGRPVTGGGGLFGEVAISTASGRQEAPAIASSSAGVYFVTWVDGREGSPRTDLYAARVSSGTVLDASGLAVYTGADDVGRPDVVVQNNFYLVAYARAATATGAADLYARRVAFDGSFPEAEFAVSAETTNEQDPALASAGSRVAVSYSRFVPGSPNDSERVRVRFMTFSGDATGEPCESASECDTGFCVDGVCCNTACGGGAEDCQACSAAAGASEDGTCSPVNPGLTCRSPISGCDLPEVCTGTTTACPANTFRGAGEVCRVADQTCELDAICSGTSPLCPANPVMPAGTFCRAPDQLCEEDATCNGVNPWCPANPLSPAGTECRPASSDGGFCDPTPELCTGTAPQCPADDNRNC